MGGVGKSTLAIRAARDVESSYPDGCLHADLRGTSDEPAIPNVVVGSFLRALGAGPQLPADQDERLALYRSMTAGRRVLVVLDNAGNEAQVRSLIPAGDRCGLLAAVAGRDRVARDPDAEHLVRLCGALPLAVRIAGARLGSHRDLSPSQFVERLKEMDGVLDLLAAGDHSVRACLTLSYTPLDPDAAGLLRLLGTLGVADVTGWTCAAVLDRTIAASRQPLDRLLGAHLMAETRPGYGEPRYRLHDLVRQFAAERARDEETASGVDEALGRVLAHYIDTAYTAGVLLSGGRYEPLISDQVKPVEPLRFTAESDAMTWFYGERTNLRLAVLEASRRGLHDHAWRLAHALRAFYPHQGRAGGGPATRPSRDRRRAPGRPQVPRGPRLGRPRQCASRRAGRGSRCLAAGPRHLRGHRPPVRRDSARPAQFRGARRLGCPAAQRLERAVGVHVHPDLAADHLEHAAVGIDDERGPPRRADPKAALDAESCPHRALRVGEQRVAQRVPLSEGGLPFHIVTADADR